MIEAHRNTPRKWRKTLGIMIAVAVLSACDTPPQGAATTPPEPGVLEPTRSGPAGATPGTCWGKTVTPAVVERAVQTEQIKPAQINPDGTVAKPPIYRTKEQQIIVTPRQDNWFETPCPDVLTAEFVASLQRALQVRGDYGGDISGTIGPDTRAAIQRFQRSEGLDSSVLSLDTARSLGLIAVRRQPAT